MSNCGEQRILGLCPRPQDFRRHVSGVRWPAMKMAPDNNCRQRPDAPSAHRRLGYPSSGCVPAEPDSVSPSNHTLASLHTICKNLSDTGVMPQKIHLFHGTTEKQAQKIYKKLHKYPLDREKTQ
jgi:hypothetical protein